MNLVKQYYGCIILCFVLIGVLSLRFAIPVRDGDLFWQIVYGRYYIEHHTLIPDHTIYTWTLAQNNIIYCAWISEIILYCLYSLGHLPLLFVFRYMCLLVVLILIFVFARRFELGNYLLTYFILLIVLLSSHSAAFIKPEIISLVLMAVVVLIYFSVKAGTTLRILYILPLIMLLWVNTHGVFVFGYLFILLITVGEILNYFFSHSIAFSKKDLFSLLGASFLSGIAVFVNPYGYHYIVQLFNYFSNPLINKIYRSVYAYHSIFRYPHLHYVDYGVTMAAILIGLLIMLITRKRVMDWAIFLANLIFGYVYTMFLRSTYLWPPIFAFSAIYLLGKFSFRLTIKSHLLMLVINLFTLGIFFFFAARSIYDAKCQPLDNTWCGFGIGYANPVQASAFLKKYHPGTRLFNDYGSGGYLMFDLYPSYKLFIDPRQFPFLNWWNEYRQFELGMVFDGFIRKYPFDVALIRYSNLRCIFNFMDSHNWRIVFYGPTAVVFVHKNVSFNFNVKKLPKERFDGLYNIYQALKVFIFAYNIADYETAWYLIEVMKKNFSLCPKYKKIIDQAILFKEAHFAYEKKDYNRALMLYEKCIRGGILLPPPKRLMELYSIIKTYGNKY